MYNKGVLISVNTPARTPTLSLFGQLLQRGLQPRQGNQLAINSSGCSSAAGYKALAQQDISTRIKTRKNMAAWCFRSCCMEQSPGPSRPRSSSGLRFSIIGASAAFFGCAGVTASAQRSFCAAHSCVKLAPSSAESGCGGYAMSCGCLVGMWHGKSSLGSLQKQGHLVHCQ
jgi:hypothetical protein